ncbi:hypothetical protein [Nostoc sp.]|uniref:hypothetical protein n=1 Tax=Nostoc sp. TaxID=1180 RepID=UPI002FFC307E
MSIITHIALKGASRNSDYFQDAFSDRLACGNAWEYSLVEHLKTQGLNKVYQVDQYLPYRSEVGYWQNKPIQPDPQSWRDNPKSELSKSLFAKFQRDIRIIHCGKGYNIEVKSSKDIFSKPVILVGGIETRWAKYRFPVHFVVAIDRTTGEARVTEADRLTRETSWHRVKSQELSYGVPRQLFKPLDSWLDFLKVY